MKLKAVDSRYTPWVDRIRATASLRERAGLVPRAGAKGNPSSGGGGTNGARTERERESGWKRKERVSVLPVLARSEKTVRKTVEEGERRGWRRRWENGRAARKGGWRRGREE